MQKCKCKVHSLIRYQFLVNNFDIPCGLQKVYKIKEPNSLKNTLYVDILIQKCKCKVHAVMWKDKVT